jgi:hypothetical protein
MTLGLSLVAHTNMGKTTLARTLLGRDIGEVRDAPHVTELPMCTPCSKRQKATSCHFGTRRALATACACATHAAIWEPTRMVHVGNLGSLARSAVWGAQQAIKNVRERADVLLYLVSAAEEPEAAGYVAPELELLACTGKPLVVLLNQLGAPGASTLASDIERWSRYIPALAPTAKILPFDAFARCWVQEIALLEAVHSVLTGDARAAAMGRLIEAWRSERLATFNASMAVLADSLVRVAWRTKSLPRTKVLGRGCVAWALLSDFLVDAPKGRRRRRRSGLPSASPPMFDKACLP